MSTCNLPVYFAPNFSVYFLYTYTNRCTSELPYALSSLCTFLCTFFLVYFPVYLINSASQLEDDCLTPKLYWIKCIKCTTQTNFKLQLQAPVKLFALQQHQRKFKICCLNVVFLFHSFVEPTQGFKRNRNIVSRKIFVSPKTFKFFVFLTW